MSSSLLPDKDQTNQVRYVCSNLMMTMEGLTKNVNFKTPGAGVDLNIT